MGRQGEMGRIEINTRGAIREHRELGVYGKAFEAAMEISCLSKKFLVEERYSLTD